MAAPERFTQILGPAQALHEDVAEELPVLQHRRTEERVERAFVNLSICKIHHVLVQVVGGTHLTASRELLAQKARTLEADAADHHVTRDEVATRQDRSVLHQPLDLSRTGAELLHEVGHKPNVAHGDGVAVVLHLLGPALRHGATGPLIELLPSEELFHVRLGVVLVLLVPGLHEVQVVNRLGADGAMPPPHDDYLCGALLQSRAHVLHSKGSHSGDDHALAAPVHTC
mmetsp:Transcript_63323/g.88035  ORF Transcript_63323/g.88035 Transcript_63323/m.88035 type:complete len:228 (+) Transcript_63323:616-1299(+)